MTISFLCNNCDKHLRAPRGAAGRKSRCPDCGNVAAVPAAGSTLSELVSGVASSATQGKPSPRANHATVERNWSVPIIVATVVVSVAVIILVAVYSHSSQKRKADERDRLTSLVQQQIATAKAAADAFVFAAAVGALDNAEKEVGDSFLSNEYLQNELIRQIEDARNGVRRHETETDYQAKIGDGWIVFEGKLISGSEHVRILAERMKKEEQQARQRREEEARRRELARQAELRRQEKERLAAAEKARPDAYSMSQEFVKKQLKVPSSAKFPVFGSSDVTVTYDDDTRKYTVLAWVEAQNPFGVYLRSSYICTLWPTEGDLWRSDFTYLSSP